MQKCGLGGCLYCLVFLRLGSGKRKSGEMKVLVLRRSGRFVRNVHRSQCLLRNLCFVGLWLAPVMAFEPELTLFAVGCHCYAFPRDLLSHRRLGV